MSVNGTERKFEESSIILIETSEGEYLLLRRAEEWRKSMGKWVPPGGHVERKGRDNGEPNEDPIEAPRRAVIRETLEETGIDISSHPISHVATFMVETPETTFKTNVFKVHVGEKEGVEIMLSEGQPHLEHDLWAWVRGDEIVRQVTSVLHPLGAPSDRPRGREDYTLLMLGLVDRELIGHQKRKVQSH